MIFFNYTFNFYVSPIEVKNMSEGYCSMFYFLFLCKYIVKKKDCYTLLEKTAFPSFFLVSFLPIPLGIIF